MSGGRARDLPPEWRSPGLHAPFDRLRTNGIWLSTGRPPFAAQREFGNKADEGFSDIWHWDEEAEARLEKLAQIDPAACEGDGLAWLLDYIPLSKRQSPHIASYLTWVALLMIECRRIMGETFVQCPDGTEHKPIRLGNRYKASSNAGG